MKLSYTVRELLACHEIFRKLGFLPQHLFVEVYGNMVQFTLRRDGKTDNDAEFRVDIHPSQTGIDKWGETVDWWNAALGVGHPDHELAQGYYRNSDIVHRQMDLLWALAKKGLIDDTKAKEKV